MNYDVLKPTQKGTVTLNSKWLKENLGLQKGEMILQANLPGGGVLLTRFDPGQYQSQQIQQALQQLQEQHNQSSQSGADTE